MQYLPLILVVLATIFVILDLCEVTSRVRLLSVAVLLVCVYLLLGRVM